MSRDWRSSPAQPCLTIEASSIDERSARRLLQGRGQGLVLIAIGTANLSDPTQVIFCLLAIALLDLPKSIIVPREDVIRIGFQRAFIPNLRKRVIAELAIGISDQIGHIRVIVVAERLQLLDSGSIVVAFVNGRIGRTVALSKRRVVEVARLLRKIITPLHPQFRGAAARGNNLEPGEPVERGGCIDGGDPFER